MGLSGRAKALIGTVVAIILLISIISGSMASVTSAVDTITDNVSYNATLRTVTGFAEWVPWVIIMASVALGAGGIAMGRRGRGRRRRR